MTRSRFSAHGQRFEETSICMNLITPRKMFSPSDKSEQHSTKHVSEKSRKPYGNTLKDDVNCSTSPKYEVEKATQPKGETGCTHTSKKRERIKQLHSREGGGGQSSPSSAKGGGFANSFRCLLHPPFAWLCVHPRRVCALLPSSFLLRGGVRWFCFLMQVVLALSTPLEWCFLLLLLGGVMCVCMTKSWK